MEIITGVERRRRWRLEEKLRIVAETEQRGAGIAEIARRYTISRGLLWNWRSQVRRGVLGPEPPAVFLPVRTISEPAGGNGTRHVLDVKSVYMLCEHEYQSRSTDCMVQMDRGSGP